MRKIIILPIIGLLASSLNGCESNPPSNGVSDTVDRSQMPAFCRGMAAEKFNQRPQNITTQAVEREDGKFYVYGYFPPSGNQTSFSCKFNSHGKFKHVHKE